MEASPRDRFDGEQRRLDEGEESVRALGDRILIERLTVADERAARVVRERAEAGTAPAESVAKAIEIGARVIDSEATAANVDYVQRVFEERVGRLHDDLSGTLEEGSAEIARHIADRFDVERADSVQGEIKEMLTAAARIQQEQLHRALTAEDGPLTAVQQRTVKQVLEAEGIPIDQVAGVSVGGFVGALYAVTGRTAPALEVAGDRRAPGLRAPSVQDVGPAVEELGEHRHLLGSQALLQAEAGRRLPQRCVDVRPRADRPARQRR
ncbi:MAG: hypothetical protein EDQ89_12225, partial [Acidobacteria bacterium]